MLSSDSPGLTAADLERSREKVAELKGRKLPQMVDWFDPLLLAKVGVRTMLSTTIGDYADQRPMQASADHSASDEELCLRHDYRALYIGSERAELGADGRLYLKPVPGEKSSAAPAKSLKLDENGALWVDFIADLGDGFEATYAMAHLIARSKLEVPAETDGAPPYNLTAGDFLIFGGDLAYPDATVKEYHDRCIAPYNAAFQLREGEQPKRKLFFISGNHDWYDGLAAFTSVFCAARDRFSQGKGKQIGGWQCEQRRSYFALGLPYRWWIWGIDLALNDTVDDAQKDYFELMSNQTGPGDKIIIILHAPIWQQKEDYHHLVEMSELARNRGAELVAVLAGDLHFYSRYHSTQPNKLDLQLITSGGGGAFAHPTHQEPLTRTIDWSVAKHPEELPHDRSDYEKTELRTTAGADEMPLNVRRPFLAAQHDFHAPAHFYPSRLKSRLLAMRNLWLPYHNRRLALFLGMVYMLYAWVFQVTVADPTEAIRKAQAVHIEKSCRSNVVTSETAAALAECIRLGKLDIDKKLELIKAKEPRPSDAELQAAIKKKAEELKGLGWANALRTVPLEIYGVLRPGFSLNRITHAMLGSPFFFLMVAGLWGGLVYYVDITTKSAWIRWPGKLIIGSMHFAAHMLLLLLTNAIFDFPYQWFTSSENVLTVAAGVSIYTFLMLMIGGFIGGGVFGIYSVLTSVIGGMHMDAFSAIGIKDYKNFLRLRFDKDGGLTIYAIGLDKVPGRHGWRPIDPVTDAASIADHNPLIMPRSDLKPRLIDKIDGKLEGKRWRWSPHP